MSEPDEDGLDRESPALDPKYAAFVDSYLLTGNASAAAKAAGFSPRQAGRLLALPDIRAEIERRQAAGKPAAADGTSREEAIRRLDNAYAMAEAAGNVSGMVQATSKKAEILGHLEEPAPAKPEVDLDRSEVAKAVLAILRECPDQHAAYREMVRDGRQRAYREIAADLGVDEDRLRAALNAPPSDDPVAVGGGDTPNDPDTNANYPLPLSAGPTSLLDVRQGVTTPRYTPSPTPPDDGFDKDGIWHTSNLDDIRRFDEVHSTAQPAAKLSNDSAIGSTQRFDNGCFIRYEVDTNGSGKKRWGCYNHRGELTAFKSDYELAVALTSGWTGGPVQRDPALTAPHIGAEQGEMDDITQARLARQQTSTLDPEGRREPRVIRSPGWKRS